MREYLYSVDLCVVQGQPGGVRAVSDVTRW